MTQVKFTTALVAGVLLCSSSAFAAYKGDVAPATSYNWSGYYAGLNLGAVKHSMDITDINATTFNATLHQTANPSITGGVQIGYRHQMDLTPVSGVFGVELSANLANASTDQVYGSSSSIYQLDASSKLQNVYLLQLMGGIAANRTLLFLSAGMSWTTLSGNVVNQATIPFFNSISLDKNPIGYVLGAGVEYAFCDKWSARFKVDVVTPNVYSTYDNLGDAFQISNHIVQATVGVNYKLG